MITPDGFENSEVNFSPPYERSSRSDTDLRAYALQTDQPLLDDDAPKMEIFLAAEIERQDLELDELHTKVIDQVAREIPINNDSSEEEIARLKQLRRDRRTALTSPVNRSIIHRYLPVINAAEEVLSRDEPREIVFAYDNNLPAKPIIGFTYRVQRPKDTQTVEAPVEAKCVFSTDSAYTERQLQVSNDLAIRLTLRKAIA